MKVIYDITNLGNGYYRSRARAGIFRVVETLALYLNKCDNIDLYFWANRSFTEMEYANHYLLNTNKFDNNFIYPNNLLFKIIMKNFLFFYPEKKYKII